MRLENGTQKRLDELSYGERILAVDKNLNPVFSKVIHFTGVFPEAMGSGTKILFQPYNTLDIQDITLSPIHLILASHGNSSNPEYVQAQEVHIGMYVYHATYKLAKVVRVETVTSRGWFTPLTEFGTIVINDLITSCHTIGPHDLVHKLYQPLQWYYSWFPQKEGDLPSPAEYQYYSVGFRRSVFGQFAIHILRILQESF